MRYEIKRTRLFDRWLSSLADRQAVNAINKRFTRLTLGNFGDAKTIGSGVFELRFFIGPGYRVYYTFKGKTLILLLCGGDKSTQSKDIRLATKIAACWEE